MKKIYFFLVLALGFTTITSASNADLFSYNETAIETEFATLTELESYVSENGASLSELNANNYLSSLNLDNKIAANANPMFSFDDIDWVSFAWGFCCWPVGCFVVVLNGNKDSDQKASFWIGLGASYVLSAISGGAYYL